MADDDVKRLTEIISGFAQVIGVLIDTLDTQNVLRRQDFRDALAKLWENVPDEADNKEVRAVLSLFLDHLKEPKRDA